MAACELYEDEIAFVAAIPLVLVTEAKYTRSDPERFLLLQMEGVWELLEHVRIHSSCFHNMFARFLKTRWNESPCLSLDQFIAMLNAPQLHVANGNQLHVEECRICKHKMNWIRIQMEYRTSFERRLGRT